MCPYSKLVKGELGRVYICSVVFREMTSEMGNACALVLKGRKKAKRMSILSFPKGDKRRESVCTSSS